MSDKTPSIEDLTKLTLFFGKVSEVHLKNLKSFPFIYFNQISEAKLDYSVATRGEEGDTLFSYDLSLDLAHNDHVDKRYKALESAIRSLFWKEAKVLIKINGKEVYKSEKK